MTACGTYAGWGRHRRDHTAPCDPCRAAAAAYQADWRRRTGRNKAVFIPASAIRAYVTGEVAT